MEDFILNISVDLTPDQVLLIIRDAVSRKYPEFAVEKLDFKVGEDYDMRGEPCGLRVKGVTLKLSKK